MEAVQDVNDGTGEPDPLKVLLISPVPGLDPMSGDVTYTQQLLAAPPPGVLYTTYEQALADGSLVEVGTRVAFRTAPRPHRVGHLLVALARKAELWMRRSGLTYREPIRVFYVPPGTYDLVHVHVFHHRFLGEPPPIVASAGGPLQWVYADAWGWSPVRIAIAEAFERVLGTLWDATMCGSRLGRAQVLIAPSQYLRQWLARRGWAPDDIVVQPNYYTKQKNGAFSIPGQASPTRLGFIARDFEAKGGLDAIAAHQLLRQTHPNLELLIVGSEPRLDAEALKNTGIQWLAELPREDLLTRVLPRIDILVYPSRFDTGVPYSAMEALAEGIPAVVSDYRSLPDLVGADAGFVTGIGDVPALATAVARLLDPITYRRTREGAKSRFEDVFSARTQAPRLGGVYRALERTRRAPSGPEPRAEWSRNDS